MRLCLTHSHSIQDIQALDLTLPTWPKSLSQWTHCFRPRFRHRLVKWTATSWNHIPKHPWGVFYKVYPNSPRILEPCIPVPLPPFLPLLPILPPFLPNPPLAVPAHSSLRQPAATVFFSFPPQCLLLGTQMHRTLPLLSPAPCPALLPTFYSCQILHLLFQFWSRAACYYYVFHSIHPAAPSPDSGAWHAAPWEECYKLLFQDF